ncbi:hypothetical protein [Desulfovibrio sp. TomC]|uniref:hypothetical protein n=1 Tax=Desulfovibrio sp. TomC TaxID=1562888 RepID=UPI00057589CC|nr:hypothetical protein [Desulfovibrio sp. TomC]KHK00205.1 hypothetical protein NY78_4388 [Desulfovibrio sp. TomC]
MARGESKFDAVKLRDLIKEGKNAQQIMDAFGVKKPQLKTYLAKLIQLDEQFYKIVGMEERAVGGASKFGKNGIHLSAALLTNYGFSQGDEFKVSCLEEGKIVLEKK